ncbi:hypothetical protein BGZ63DRAFT_421199 [Mariannaea sp. PMI_226]|nr:hypothetical protein BGZ63DRAFT_421199 [Mariannaea sp. PMI_226]
MTNKVFLAAVAADILFLASGLMELIFSLVVRSQMNDIPTNGQEATLNLLYQRFPLTAGIVNASFILLTFVATIPGLFMPARGILKIGGYMVTFCAIFTLCVGVFLWVMTLRVRGDFFSVYSNQDPSVQSLIQTSFECCGYLNSTAPAFVTDTTCPSPAAAALLRGCATAFSSFANVHIDNIFTVVFGIVGIDAIFVLCIACLLKDRKERERYRHIDEKAGFRTL